MPDRAEQVNDGRVAHRCFCGGESHAPMGFTSHGIGWPRGAVPAAV